MKSPSDQHPKPAELRAFGIGKLEPAASETIVQHLETCVECRQVVSESSGDGFLSRLRAAQPSSPASLDRTGPYVSDAQAIPPELAENPEYEDLIEVGRGGMGVVYKARNTMMGRDEVLKVMSKEMMARPGAIDRFRREVQSAARLDHPNIVRAYSARLLGDLLVFSMEFVPGEELGKLVHARGPLPIAHACYYVQQVAAGLQHAHEKGMVHRDIKPANLILRVEGKKHTVKVLDFGLAKMTSERGHDTGLTGEGRMLGTPDYIAPEQILDAQSAGIRADIYSLGCTLYFLLTGQPPFHGDSLYDLLRKHQEEEPEPLNQIRPEVPAELVQVLNKMIAKKPGQRYQTPAEVAKALTPFVKPQSSSGPKGNAGLMPIVTPLPGAPKPVRNMWETMAVDSTSVKQLVAKPKKQRGGIQAWAIPAAIVGSLVIGSLILWKSGVLKPKPEDEPPVVLAKGTPAAVSKAPPTVVTTLPPPIVLPKKAAEPKAAFAWPEVALREGRIPAPDLKTAKRLFHDDFNDPKSGFFVDQKPDGGAGYADGRYFFHSSVAGVYDVARLKTYSNFALQITGRTIGGDGWGISFRRENQKQPLQVSVLNDGNARIAEDFSRERLRDQHVAVKRGQEFNTLLVIVRGRSIEFYVNGIAVCDPIVLDEGVMDVNPWMLTHQSGRQVKSEFEEMTIWSAEDLPTPEQRLANIVPAKPAAAWTADDLKEGRIPAPDLSKAKKLLEDSFKDPKSGFENHVDMDGAREAYVEGKYVITNPAGTYRRTHRNRTESWGEAAYEVRGRLKAGLGDGWGLQINNFQQKIGVLVLLGNNGSVTISRGAVDAVKEGLSGPKPEKFSHSAVKQDGEWNTLLLIARKGSIEVYVSGVAICNPIAVDPKFDPNRIQLTLSTVGAGEVEFERITVYSAEGLPRPK